VYPGLHENLVVSPAPLFASVRRPLSGCGKYVHRMTEAHIIYAFIASVCIVFHEIEQHSGHSTWSTLFASPLENQS
jgi:hypothetical protein